MKRIFYIFSLFLCAMAFSAIQAENSHVVVTASNSSDTNELLVYDTDGKFLQAIPTQGKGGVPANMVGGGIAKNDQFVAVINYGSQSVSLFVQEGDSFKLVQVIDTMSKPVSLAFGHDHLYILGTTTIESHKANHNKFAVQPDGSSRLLVGDGSAAQVGVLPNHLIISERSNAIELVELRKGVVTDIISPVQLPPPPDNDTPVGLATRGEAAYVTIAHSDKVGLVRNGKLVKLVSSDYQKAPCWLTLLGPWLYCSNTPSKSISRYRVSENELVLEELIAAKTEGLPSDIDAEDGILAVLDTGKGPAHISQFKVDANGHLRLMNTTTASQTANGVAVIRWQR